MTREQLAAKALDPVALAETERLLEQPLPPELHGIGELAVAYRGPNSGLVVGLIAAALRIARGAVDDGVGLAKMLVEERENRGLHRQRSKP